jgi:probable rRNA maturation factor
VQYGVPRRGVPAPASLRRWAHAALAGRRRAAEVTLRVVGRAEGSELNQRYRGRPGPTNVLSFPFEAPPGVRSACLGDIVLCAPVVAEEAADQGKPPAAHWAHLVVHGILHLLGHDHQNEVEAARMEALEVRALRRLGVGDPYGDRDGP